jgi:hypothetical protein
LLFGRVKYGCPGLDASVVHHNVEPAERLHSRSHQPFEVSDLANVCVHADGLIAKRRNAFFEFVCGVRVGDIVDNDVGTLFCQFEHDGLADAAVATSNDGDFVFQEHD